MKHNCFTSMCASILCLLVIPSLFGQAMKPLPSDGIQYVSTKGSDANDGLSRGTAKSTIASAVDALPSCSRGASIWTHCGIVRLGAGRYIVSSPIIIRSPYVSLRGNATQDTLIQYTGTTGCAIEWTTSFPNTFVGNAAPLNLSDLAINGSGAAGVCGLETYDMDSFRAEGVTITGFTGAGSSGWLDTAFAKFNERYDVSLTLGNNTTGWMIKGGVGRPGYAYAGTTFGYGDFNLWINTARSGQVGVHADNHAIITYSNIHLIENLAAGSTGLELTNHSELTADMVNFHFEGGATGISADATSVIQVIGSVHEHPGMKDTFGGSYPQDYILGYWNGPCPAGSHCALSFTPYQRATANYALTLGQATDVGRSAELAIGIPPGGYNPPFAIGNAGNVKFWIDTSGNPHSSSGYLISAGTMRLSEGTASHTFKTPYTSVPVCTATDTTGSAAVRVTSTTTAISVSGTNDDVVAWICTPLAN